MKSQNAKVPKLPIESGFGVNKSQNYNLKIKIFLIFFLTLVFHFSLLTFHLREARAESLALSLSPPVLEVIIKPGKSITQVYKITNDGDPAIVTAKISELTENGIFDNPDFTPDKWITVLNADLAFDKPFLLDSKVTRQLILKVNPPVGIPEKDYYRVIYFETSPGPVVETSQSSVSQKIGSPLLVTVTGTGLIAKGAQISKFQLPRIIDSFDPLTTRVEVKNSGNSFFHPVGTINLKGSPGQASFNIVPNVILSGQNRLIATENGNSSSIKEFTLNLPGIYLGKYTLDIDFTLDEGTIHITQSKNFYALPWKALLVLIIIVIIVIKFIIKKKKKKKVKK